MPRGGQARDGVHGTLYGMPAEGPPYMFEYRLVVWEGQWRIGFRWNRWAAPPHDASDCPQGKYTFVPLDATLYPAIIGSILPPEVRQAAIECLGPDLAGGNYPNAMQQNPNQNYHHPQHVTSPRGLLGPFHVVLNNGPGDGAYMIGW